MAHSRTRAVETAAISVVGLVLAGLLGLVWVQRLPYPYDLEWMEGGMLAHAWRLQQGLPLYVVEADWAPFIYPPGYPALLAMGPLSPALGRAISLLGTLAAAAAVSHVVRREGGSWDLALGVALVFLGTYESSGAFFDLVRPDPLGVGLLAWSIALALDGRRHTEVASGLLLACAFGVKHNLAAFGLPLLLGLALRGWRPAARFAVASIGPAALLIGLLQLWSDGLFLTFLVDVPRSHELVWERAWRGSVREWGTALPVAFGAGGLALVWSAMHRQRAVPVWAAAGLTVWTGMLLAWWGTYAAPPPDSGLRNGAAGVAFWGLGAASVAVALRVGAASAGLGERMGWRTWVWLGLVGTSVGLCALMRAHEGGFLNVHIPLFWTVSAAAGVLAVRVRRLQRGGPWVAAAICLQLAWSVGRTAPGPLVPTQADRDAGDRLVAALESADGPVLSPFATWIPVYAGHDPSLHAMAVWDLNHVDGPLFGAIEMYDQAFEDRRWATLVGANQGFMPGVSPHYEQGAEVIPAAVDDLAPKTGWRAKPVGLLHPAK